MGEYFSRNITNVQLTIKLAKYRATTTKKCFKKDFSFIVQVRNVSTIYILAGTPIMHNFGLYLFLSVFGGQGGWWWWTLLVASCMQLRVYNKQVTKLKLSSPCHIEIPLCGQCCRLGCWCYFVDVVFKFLYMHLWWSLIFFLFSCTTQRFLTGVSTLMN